MTMSKFRLVAADGVDFRMASYGEVRSVEGLYDARIFGPKEDSKCECGKYVGEQYHRIICDRCGVRVAGDSGELRKQRMGHVALPRPCQHPLDSAKSIDVFPIA